MLVTMILSLPDKTAEGVFLCRTSLCPRTKFFKKTKLKTNKHERKDK